MTIKSEGSPLSGAVESRHNLVCGRSKDRNHDAVMRIGSEAPKRRTHSSNRHESQGTCRESATSNRHRYPITSVRTGPKLSGYPQRPPIIVPDAKRCRRVQRPATRTATERSVACVPRPRSWACEHRAKAPSFWYVRNRHATCTMPRRTRPFPERACMGLFESSRVTHFFYRRVLGSISPGLILTASSAMMQSGCQSEGSPLSGAVESRHNLVCGRSKDRNHDAVMRIGSEAPKRRTHSSNRHESQGTCRESATSNRHQYPITSVRTAPRLPGYLSVLQSLCRTQNDA